jgi:8-oxo-dGTP pyrophosphatase MutT (NUDIX family)
VILDDAEIRRRLSPAEATWRSEAGLRDAAVLLPLVRRRDRDVLVFTLRRPDLAAHAGQISFPGGGRHGPDEDPVRTALRETEEEIGLAAAALDVLGRLPDRVSIAGYLVAPFVARVREEPVYRPLESEVAEVFELPVAAMLERERWSFRPSTHPLARFAQIPYVDVEGRTVWGLTGIILRDFVRTALGFDPGDAGDSPH